MANSLQAALANLNASAAGVEAKINSIAQLCFDVIDRVRSAAADSFAGMLDDYFETDGGDGKVSHCQHTDSAKTFFDGCMLECKAVRDRLGSAEYTVDDVRAMTTEWHNAAIDFLAECTKGDYDNEQEEWREDDIIELS